MHFWNLVSCWLVDTVHCIALHCIALHCTAKSFCKDVLTVAHRSGFVTVMLLHFPVTVGYSYCSAVQPNTGTYTQCVLCAKLPVGRRQTKSCRSYLLHHVKG
jgi:hypothetical protein